MLANEKYKGDELLQKAYTVSGKIICGKCGRPFGRRLWSGNDERLKKFVWICSQRNISKGVKGCRNKHVYDKTLITAFVDIFSNMIENKDYFIEKWTEVINNGNEF